MENINNLLACPECDVLHMRQSLSSGQSASCIRCGAKLYSKSRYGMQGVLALSLSGLIFYGLMISFPFLGITTNGIERNIDLVSSVGEMYKHNSPLVAILVGLVLIVFPLSKALGLVVLVAPFLLGRRLPGYHHYCNLVERLVPWNMTEIYLVGMIVTFVKLSSLANIIYGVAFWGFIGFVVSMTSAIALLDFSTLWSKLNEQNNQNDVIE